MTYLNVSSSVPLECERWISGISVNIGYDRRKPDYIGECRSLRSSDRIWYDRRKSDYIGECRSVMIGNRRKTDRSVNIGFRLKPDYIGEWRFFRSFDHIGCVRRKTDCLGEFRSVGVYRKSTQTGSIGGFRVPMKTGFYRWMSVPPFVQSFSGDLGMDVIGECRDDRWMSGTTEENPVGSSFFRSCKISECRVICECWLLRLKPETADKILLANKSRFW